ncbi:hypothetical protein LINGRAHAP2_LOCUS31684, partial [Linum grandiflorum]
MTMKATSLSRRQIFMQTFEEEAGAHIPTIPAMATSSPKIPSGPSSNLGTPKAATVASEENREENS